MKTQNTNLLAALSNDSKKELMETVQETIALNIDQAAKNFSAAQLWRIQSNRKVRTIRRLVA